MSKLVSQEIREAERILTNNAEAIDDTSYESSRIEQSRFFNEFIDLRLKRFVEDCESKTKKTVEAVQREAELAMQSHNKEHVARDQARLERELVLATQKNVRICMTELIDELESDTKSVLAQLLDPSQSTDISTRFFTSDDRCSSVDDLPINVRLTQRSTYSVERPRSGLFGAIKDWWSGVEKETVVTYVFNTSAVNLWIDVVVRSRMEEVRMAESNRIRGLRDEVASDIRTALKVLRDTRDNARKLRQKSLQEQKEVLETLTVERISIADLSNKLDSLGSP
jgi:hypothetical protein